MPVAAVGATTTAVALRAPLIWGLGNNFPPRARRPRKHFTTSGWLLVTLSSGRQGRLSCGPLGLGQHAWSLWDPCSRWRLVSDFSLSSPRPGVSGQLAASSMLDVPGSEQARVEPLSIQSYLLAPSSPCGLKALGQGLLSSSLYLSPTWKSTLGPQELLGETKDSWALCQLSSSVSTVAC